MKIPANEPPMITSKATHGFHEVLKESAEKKFATFFPLETVTVCFVAGSGWLFTLYFVSFLCADIKNHKL
jgi:hypothetical protein